MSSKPVRVFLSYALPDREIARTVGERLSREGFLIWDPETEILPGDNFAAALDAALRAADAMVLFISPEAMKSRSVTRELEYALGARHLSGRVIPVMLKPTRNAPWILESLQPVKHDTPETTSNRIAESLRKPAYVPQAKQRAN